MVIVALKIQKSTSFPLDVRNIITTITSVKDVKEQLPDEFQASENRRLMGIGIATTAKIEKVDGLYLVPSMTTQKPTKHRVFVNETTSFCSCEDYRLREQKCKHIFAVEFLIQNGESKSGIIEPPRKTYSQNWSAYNKAQQNEKRDFQKLLAELCKGLESKEKCGRGRPSLALSDSIFSIVYKVYSTFSARRFTSDLCDAQTNGFISRVPHYNTALRCLENPEIFQVLVDLIERASLPLKAVEENFAADSTGFAFCRFDRWYDIKYNRFTSAQKWVKAHFMTGVKTNIVTAVEIHNPMTQDAPIFPSLLATTVKNFVIEEVLADKGYSSIKNSEAVAACGAMPFIAYKSNHTGKGDNAWSKMYHYFSCYREDFLKHYHQRSNVESTVMMVKTKFGDSVRSKSEVAAKNEVLCKFLCHNICCLISTMYENGMEIEF